MSDPVAKLATVRKQAEQRSHEQRVARERAAKENRERYPDLAKFVDELRAVFGEVKIVEVKENGKMLSAMPNETGNRNESKERAAATPLR